MWGTKDGVGVAFNVEREAGYRGMRAQRGEKRAGLRGGKIGQVYRQQMLLVSGQHSIG